MKRARIKRIITCVMVLALAAAAAGCGSVSKPAGSWARAHHLHFEDGDVTVPFLCIGTNYYKEPWGEDIIKFAPAEATYQFTAAERTKEKKDGSVTYKFVIKALLDYVAEDVDEDTINSGDMYIYTLAENIHLVDLYTGFVYPTDAVGRVEYSKNIFDNEYKETVHTVTYINEVEYSTYDSGAYRTESGSLNVTGEDEYEIEITVTVSDDYKGLGLFLPKAGATDPKMLTADKGYEAMQFEDMPGFTDYDDYYFWGCHDMTDYFLANWAKAERKGKTDNNSKNGEN